VLALDKARSRGGASVRRFFFWGCAFAATIASGACGHTSGTLPPPVRKGYPTSAPPAANTTSATAPAPTPTDLTAPATATAQLAPPPGTAVTADDRGPPPGPAVSMLPPTRAAYVKHPYEPPMPLAPPSPPLTSPSPSTSPSTSDGRRFFVRGVDRSDVLNIRAEPGPKSPVIGEIPPEATGIVSTGARRQVGPGIWREVSYRGVRGWVNERFLVEEDGNSRVDSSTESASP
jgi:hypothetical protein